MQTFFAVFDKKLWEFLRRIKVKTIKYKADIQMTNFRLDFLNERFLSELKIYDFKENILINRFQCIYDSR